MTAFGTRWIEQLLERYNASGPGALANGRRRNGLKPSLLTAEVLEVVRLRLAEPPPDGGLWSSRKVADVMAAHLGLERVLPQRGWEVLKAIGWSLQRPRPKNPKSATAEEAQAFKKSWRTSSPRKPPLRLPRFDGSSSLCVDHAARTIRRWSRSRPARP